MKASRVRTLIEYVLLGLVIGGALIGTYAVVTLLSGSPVLDVLSLAVVVLPSALGAWYWLRAGASWLATLSWTAPLFLWMAFMSTSIVPNWVAGLGGGAGILFAIVMSGADEARGWWLRNVLRRSS